MHVHTAVRFGLGVVDEIVVLEDVDMDVTKVMVGFSDVDEVIASGMQPSHLSLQPSFPLVKITELAQSSPVQPMGSHEHWVSSISPKLNPVRPSKLS